MSTVADAPSRSGKLARFLGRESLLLALVLVVLPNALFLVAMPFFIAERMLSPVMYLLAGMAAFLLPSAAAYVLFAGAALIDLGLIVMVAFHLPLETAFHSLRYAATADFAASTFYVGLVTFMFAIAIVTAWSFNRYRNRMRGGSALIALLCVFALMGLDMRYNLPYVEKTTPPFESALSRNAMTAASIAARGNNVLVVMVEGLGAFAKPGEKRFLEGKLAAVAKQGGYRLETGTTNYSGSTTGAASRELCGRWGDYVDYLSGKTFDCLPNRLSSRGFQTIAFHGYTSDLFNRDNWYPRIGFDELHFQSELVSDGVVTSERRCGSVFNGLCDADVGAAVMRRLKADPDHPKFVYWLTLNTHIPYVPKSRGPLACGSPQAAIANREVCELTELWGDVFDAVATIARHPDLPPTDILLVGDHHTPMWSRAAKSSFVYGKTDWYLLRENEAGRAALGGG